MDHTIKSFLSPQSRELNHNTSLKGMYTGKTEILAKKVPYNYHVDEYERQENARRQERMHHRERIIAQT
jgi:hypothetical protein